MSTTHGNPHVQALREDLVLLAHETVMADNTPEEHIRVWLCASAHITPALRLQPQDPVETPEGQHVATVVCPPLTRHWPCTRVLIFGGANDASSAFHSYSSGLGMPTDVNSKRRSCRLRCCLERSSNTSMSRLPPTCPASAGMAWARPLNTTRGLHESLRQKAAARVCGHTRGRTRTHFSNTKGLGRAPIGCFRLGGKRQKGAVRPDLPAKQICLHACRCSV
eukprot:1175276-Amphidinium_carterae.1